MTDQLISFETAKLAKEKSFDEITDFIFDTNMNKKLGGWIIPNINGLKHSDGNNPFVSAPTQSLLQKWLREEHEIHIVCTLISYFGFYGYEILRTGKSPIVNNLTSCSYEKALESGLRKALKLI